MNEAYCQIKNEDYVTVEGKIYSYILKMWSLLSITGWLQSEYVKNMYYANSNQKMII